MRGVLPLLRLSVRLDGPLTRVPMVLGVGTVPLVPLGVQLLGGLQGSAFKTGARTRRFKLGNEGKETLSGNCRKLLTEGKELSRANAPGGGEMSPSSPSGWEGGGLRTSELSLSTGVACDTPHSPVQ